jgi:hypothetical protein
MTPTGVLMLWSVSSKLSAAGCADRVIFIFASSFCEFVQYVCVEAVLQSSIAPFATSSILFHARWPRKRLAARTPAVGLMAAPVYLEASPEISFIHF